MNAGLCRHGRPGAPARHIYGHGPGHDLLPAPPYRAAARARLSQHPRQRACWARSARLSHCRACWKCLCGAPFVLSARRRGGAAGVLCCATTTSWPKCCRRMRGQGANAHPSEERDSYNTREIHTGRPRARAATTLACAQPLMSSERTPRRCAKAASVMPSWQHSLMFSRRMPRRCAKAASVMPS